MLQHPPTPQHASSTTFAPWKTPSRRTSLDGLPPTPLPPTPSRSSPLSSRVPSTFNNSPTCGQNKQQPPIFALSSAANLPSPPRSPQNVPSFMTPRRLFKPNPINRSREETRGARRDLFLKKVQNGRFDKKVAARGGDDEMMRMIFVAEQKRWEKSLESAAPDMTTILEDGEQFAEVEIEDAELDPGLLAGEYDEEIERMARLAESTYEQVPGQKDEFDEYLDRDGQELETLLSQMDLDVEMN